jgi:hypothetical protein
MACGKYVSGLRQTGEARVKSGEARVKSGEVDEMNALNREDP